jgi:beta-glucuronidase
LGFYVWEESHARAVSFDQPKFGQQIADSTREMVEWHYNRPSIIMWGCLNECESNSSKGRKVYQSVLGLLREMDPTRPVTFASNRFQADMCLDLVDIVSFNLYAAWYGGGPDNVEPNLKDLLKWIHSDESGGKGKPMIVSECGAGAIYGSRNPNRAKWTEEYQADCLDACLDVYLKHPDVIGVALWQFCDVRVTQGWWGKRPRTMNNKGTVDEYRRPKLAYDVVKQRFHAAPKRRPRKRKPTRATKKN